MAEIGLDISKAFPRPLIDEVVQAADVVVTMDAATLAPVYPGKLPNGLLAASLIH